MTSVAFIMGVVPLVLATGSGRRGAAGDGHRGVRRHARRHLFGLFLTPVFYVVVQGLAARLSPRRPPAVVPQTPAAAEGH